MSDGKLKFALGHHQLTEAVIDYLNKHGLGEPGQCEVDIPMDGGMVTLGFTAQSKTAKKPPEAHGAQRCKVSLPGGEPAATGTPATFFGFIRDEERDIVAVVRRDGAVLLEMTHVSCLTLDP